MSYSKKDVEADGMGPKVDKWARCERCKIGNSNFGELIGLYTVLCQIPADEPSVDQRYRGRTIAVARYSMCPGCERRDGRKKALRNLIPINHGATFGDLGVSLLGIEGCVMDRPFGCFTLAELRSGKPVHTPLSGSLDALLARGEDRSGADALTPLAEVGPL